MKKIKKIELFEERLVKLEQNQKKDAEMMTDLLDYLMRVDENFINNPGAFEGWYMRLIQMRNEDVKRYKCAKAKQLLEDEGFVVAEDPTGLDAARMKKWVKQNSKTNDDDIPF